MPKRPCAITLTADDLTLLCADKFGDVYALPLLGQNKTSSNVDGTKNNEAAEQTEREIPNQVVPSASTLTVHTKRNRDALRQQQNMIRKKPPKKPVSINHRLALGHVSLLTDVICAVVPSISGVPRNYILTADRDEHIRVSRGLPQAHIIENFCLGHTQFISKLCLVPSHPRLLISGGGDDFLLLWDWLTGQVKGRVDLKAKVDHYYRSSSVGAKNLLNNIENSEKNITISSINCLASERYILNSGKIAILVTFEG